SSSATTDSSSSTSSLHLSSLPTHVYSPIPTQSSSSFHSHSSSPSSPPSFSRHVSTSSRLPPFIPSHSLNTHRMATKSKSIISAPCHTSTYVAVISKSPDLDNSEPRTFKEAL
ncbi:hypothetical protein U1Q18_022964, partial [Sarracenia purpurea var. burkii]